VVGDELPKVPYRTLVDLYVDLCFALIMVSMASVFLVYYVFAEYFPVHSESEGVVDSGVEGEYGHDDGHDDGGHQEEGIISHIFSNSGWPRWHGHRSSGYGTGHTFHSHRYLSEAAVASTSTATSTHYAWQLNWILFGASFLIFFYFNCWLLAQIYWVKQDIKGWKDFNPLDEEVQQRRRRLILRESHFLYVAGTHHHHLQQTNIKSPAASARDALEDMDHNDVDMKGIMEKRDNIDKKEHIDLIVANTQSNASTSVVSIAQLNLHNSANANANSNANSRGSGNNLLFSMPTSGSPATKYEDINSNSSNDVVKPNNKYVSVVDTTKSDNDNATVTSTAAESVRMVTNRTEGTLINNAFTGDFIEFGDDNNNNSNNNHTSGVNYASGNYTSGREDSSIKSGRPSGSKYANDVVTFSNEEEEKR
jgi:Tfp pilus assembly protein PilV